MLTTTCSIYMGVVYEMICSELLYWVVVVCCFLFLKVIEKARNIQQNIPARGLGLLIDLFTTTVLLCHHSIDRQYLRLSS